MTSTLLETDVRGKWSQLEKCGRLGSNLRPLDWWIAALTKCALVTSFNKRTQKALGCSPEEKVKGHSGAIYRRPLVHQISRL